ncbi:hypothetical protein BG011_002991 [Mortierella polycephala]|uniref:Uncharacterized protein n=1 Tax=Mortierella polycephala TaxID=41804 RepID=A0A9P6Q589_9FUNG|nr:hypothetical protein BG011_002991 [Mortierella polycephala]
MESTQDPNDAAYMAMLTRKIPGVGDTPLVPTSTATATAAKTTAAATDHQRQAMEILERAITGSLFVSEGDEPFQVVHIVPNGSSFSTAETSSTDSSSLPLPSESEFVRILKDTQLSSLGTISQYDINSDNDEELTTCEKTSDLQSILRKSNPGADRIAKALQDIYHYDPSSSTSSAPVALYRVTLPSSSTRVHLWIVGKF